jgi:hypothetical protein
LLKTKVSSRCLYSKISSFIKVFSKSIGYFIDGKRNGEFKEYLDLDETDHIGKTWMKKYYKNGLKIKKRKSI